MRVHPVHLMETTSSCWPLDSFLMYIVAHMLKTYLLPFNIRPMWRKNLWVNIALTMDVNVCLLFIFYIIFLYYNYILQVDQTAFIITSSDHPSRARVRVFNLWCSSVVGSQHVVLLESASVFLCSLPSLVLAGLHIAANRSGRSLPTCTS